MPQTESLTVEILGDSSGLQQELTEVADQLDQLQQQLTDVGGASQDFADSFGSLSAAIGPLEALSQQLGLLSQQVQTLSSQSISLNVQPALDALAELMQSAQAAAAQLAAVSEAAGLNSAAGSAAGLAGLTGTGFGDAGSNAAPRAPRAYAGGGLVSGPGGIDQVPARLSAGEFVLKREAVASLGVPLLDSLNQTAVPAISEAALNPIPEPATPAAPPFSPFAAVETAPISFELPTLEEFRRPPMTGQAPPAASLPPDLSQRAIPVFSGQHSGDGMRNSPEAGWERYRPGSPNGPEAVPSQTLNQFGGIEIHVRETADVDQLLGDLRRQGIGLRHRRG